MSLDDISMFYILGEDAHHRSFAQAWLVAKSVHHRKIVPMPPPAGKGGGWKYVLATCKGICDDALFRNKTKAKTRLILVIDADEYDIQSRIEQILASIVPTDSQSLGEILYILVPKRHIETWVHALNSPNAAIDEQLDYKEKSSSDVKQAARIFARMPSPPASPPSLIHGYDELSRLKNG